MTIEADPAGPAFAANGPMVRPLGFRGWLVAALVLPLLWVALLAAVMRVSDAAPAALVLLPPPDLLSRLPADVALVSATPVSVTLRSTGGTGLVAALYAAGAPLVLPAGLRLCLPDPVG